MIRIIIILLLLVTLSVAWASNDFYIHVTNPDTSKYTVSWTGPGPNCSINDARGETNTWIYHHYGKNVIVFIKDLVSNNVICTVDIDSGLSTRGAVDIVITGNDCYKVSPNGDISGMMRLRSTWITTIDVPPYLVHQCGD